MQAARSTNRSLCCLWWLAVAGLLAVVWLIDTAAAQRSTVRRGPGTGLVTWYKVDPTWPQRPASAHWGAMPGVAVDEEGHVWLFTRAKPPVQVYTTDGRYLRGWGEELVGEAHHIEIDCHGNVWLADIGKHVVMQFTKEGRLLRTLGTPGQPGNDDRHLNGPTDMAVTPDGEVFVSDGYGNSRVVHFDKHGKFVKAWGTRGTGPGQFRLPHAIGMDSKGRLYVADRENARVQVFDQDGRFLAQWRDLIVPWGIWVTDKDQIWVCGSSPMPDLPGKSLPSCPPKDQVLMKFDPSGRLLQLWTVPKAAEGAKTTPGQCNWLHGVALDAAGNIYVGDIMGQRAQKFVRQR